MDTKGIRLLDMIGADGLRAAVRQSFDRAGLVGIANGCGLSFPGKRARAVDGETILDELMKRFLEDGKVRAVVMKALIRANETLIERFRPLTPAEISHAVSGIPDNETARALFALGEHGRDTARGDVTKLRERLGLSPRPDGPAAAGPDGEDPASPAREERRLNEEIALLRQRVDRLDRLREEQEALVAALRSSESELQQTLLASRKEAHHQRKETARLEEENLRLQKENRLLAGRAAAGPAPGSGNARIDDLSTRVSQLIRENRKLAHDIGTLMESRPSGEAGRPYLDALAASIEALRREVSELRTERDEQSSRVMKAVSELAAEVNMTRSDLAQWRRTAAEPTPRRRGDPDRVGIFVDVQNMYYAARQLNARLDFGALMTAATRDRRLIRAYAYVVQNRDIDQSGFLSMLQQRNYEVRLKDLKIRNDGSSKGDWDMEMALDMLRLAGNLEVVVLASGDGDFTSLVTQIRTLGPRVEVYSFSGSTAKELIEAADRYVPIDEGFLIRMPSSV